MLVTACPAAASVRPARTEHGRMPRHWQSTPRAAAPSPQSDAHLHGAQEPGCLAAGIGHYSARVEGNSKTVSFSHRRAPGVRYLRRASSRGAAGDEGAEAVVRSQHRPRAKMQSRGSFRTMIIFSLMRRNRCCVAAERARNRYHTDRHSRHCWQPRPAEMIGCSAPQSDSSGRCRRKSLIDGSRRLTLSAGTAPLYRACNPERHARSPSDPDQRKRASHQHCDRCRYEPGNREYRVLVGSRAPRSRHSCLLAASCDPCRDRLGVHAAMEASVSAPMADLGEPIRWPRTVWP